MKKKILRDNHTSYMTKEKKSCKGLKWKLRIYKLKQENFEICKKQENVCGNLYKKERKVHYDTLEVKK